uniref:EF-hand domain-containing protein n=1 Tax=Mola mola TaxID=94237 RepID=A0A3Q3WQ07_MOLML
MGNTRSGALSKEILEELKLNTKFTETEIVQWYENFKRQCPTGRITKEEFESIYSRFFPDSDAQTYAQHVFRSFDTNDDGTLDFKEYIINGYITKSEVREICMANFKLIPKDELSQLHDDENTAEKRADKLWKFFDKGENGEARHLAEGEFIQGVLDNEVALRLIQYQPSK